MAESLEEIDMDQRRFYRTMKWVWVAIALFSLLSGTEAAMYISGFWKSGLEVIFPLSFGIAFFSMGCWVAYECRLASRH